MDKLRGMPPVGFAVVFGVILLVQLLRTGNPAPVTNATTNPAPTPPPCLDSILAPSMVDWGTPVAGGNGAQSAAITTTLVVTAADEGLLRLQPSLSVFADSNSPEVLKAFSIYLSESETAAQALDGRLTQNPGTSTGDSGLPDWKELRFLLESVNPENAGDIGLYLASPSQVEASRSVGIPTATAREETPGTTTTDAPQPISNPHVDQFMDDISGPPIIYANDETLVVHARGAERTLGEGRVWYGLWKDVSQGGTTRLRIAAQPTNAIWNAELCVDGLQILSVDPPPDAMKAHRLTWSFAPATDSTEQVIEVAIEPLHPSWLRQWINSGARGAFVLAWALLAPAVLLLLGLWFSHLSGPVADPVREARTRLRATSLAIVKLALSGVLVLAIDILLVKGAAPARGNPWWEFSVLALSGAIICSGLVDLPAWHGAGFQRGIRQAVPSLAFISGIAGILLLTVLTNEPRHLSAVWVPLQHAVLVAGYFTFLVVAVRLRDTLPASVADAGRHAALEFMGAIGLIICTHTIFGRYRQPSAGFDPRAWIDEAIAVATPLWVTACVIIGFVSLVSTLLPDQLRRRGSTSAWRTHAVLATLIVLVTNFVHWVVALYRHQTFIDRARVAMNPQELPAVYSQRLQDDFVDYLKAFLAPTLNLLPLLGLVGLVGMLGAAAWTDRAMLSRTDRAWIGRTLIFLYAAFVVGYGGAVVGLRAPIAFLVGLVFLPLVLVLRPEGQPARGVSPSGTLPDESPLPELRAKAAQRSVYFQGATPGAIPVAAIPTNFGPVATQVPLPAAFHQLLGWRNPRHARRSRPRQATAPLSIEGDMAPTQPLTALAPSPNRAEAKVMEQWWADGALAVRKGAWLAIAPVAFFVYVFMMDVNSGIGSTTSSFAMAAFMSNVAYEVGFWLVAAFVLGCLYAYLRGSAGLTKGLILAAVYVGANAVAALVGAPGDALWKVRSFQLMLFLILLGAWIDFESVPAREHTLEGFGKHVLSHYALNETISWVKYVLPLASTLAMVAYQIYSEKSFNAVVELTSAQSENELITLACGLARIPNCK